MTRTEIETTQKDNLSVRTRQPLVLATGLKETKMDDVSVSIGEEAEGRPGSASPATPVEELVSMLLRSIHRDTAHQSNLNAVRRHESYVALVGVGEAAVPTLVNIIRRDPAGVRGVWAVILALQDITGADPVAEEDRGMLYQMCDAWVQWFDGKRLQQTLEV